MSDRVTIRRAGVADAPTVQELLLELADHEHVAHAVHVDVDGWRRLLALPEVVVLLAFRASGEPVGYVSGVRQLHLWQGRTIFAMDDLYVRSAARNLGIGAQLMAALAEEVSDERLVIRWGVDLDNLDGHRFYERLGATLRTKVVATWQPHDYAVYLAERAP
jgi:GNAT superfamily N-acetyltransferase